MNKYIASYGFFQRIQKHHNLVHEPISLALHRSDCWVLYTWGLSFTKAHCFSSKMVKPQFELGSFLNFKTWAQAIWKNIIRHPSSRTWEGQTRILLFSLPTCADIWFFNIYIYIYANQNQANSANRAWIWTVA